MTENTSPFYQSPPFRGLWSKQRSCSQPAASVHKRSLSFIECGLWSFVCSESWESEFQNLWARLSVRSKNQKTPKVALGKDEIDDKKKQDQDCVKRGNNILLIIKSSCCQTNVELLSVTYVLKTLNNDAGWNKIIT